MELLDIAGWFVLLSIAFAVLWKVYGSRQCFRVGTLGTLALWFAVTLRITVLCRNLSPSWSTSPLSILGDTRVVCVPVLSSYALAVRNCKFLEISQDQVRHSSPCQEIPTGLRPSE